MAPVDSDGVVSSPESLPLVDEKPGTGVIVPKCPMVSGG